MKAAMFNDTRDMNIIEMDIPSLGSEDVLIEVQYCGICGTDNLIYTGNCYANRPLILGHEYSGLIVETGKNVCKYRTGMNVIVDPNVYCGTCSYCRTGKIHLCENLISLGVIRNGGFATHSIVPEKNVYMCDDRIGLDEGALAEPLACCIHGIERSSIGKGDSVLILGAGIIGNMMIQLSRLSGAGLIIVSEPLEFRQESARKSGADIILDPTNHDVGRAVGEISSGGADIVIECSGNEDAQVNSMDFVKKGGTILLFGCSPEKRRIAISPFLINHNELSIIGSTNNPFCHEKAIRLIASKKIKLKHLITHTFELDRIHEAFDAFGKADTLKILVCPSI
jgi:2-desacetyl-2-hydroxyethyl bacteriochlorophyllide A dehydrogenase